jgi:hypothetical protein
VTDPHVLGPDLLPTPFTADEIREGCPEGRLTRTRVQSGDEAPHERFSRFVDCDDTGAVMERGLVTADGSPVGEPLRARMTWRDLQAHAAFPSERTTVAHEVIETPLGQLECLRYTVLAGADIDTFWFDTGRPGMPVQVTTERDGHIVESSTMIADERPDPSP